MNSPPPRFKRAHLVLGAVAGILLIHAVSRPDSVGGGARLLRISEIKVAEAAVVGQVGGSFSLKIESAGTREPMRIFDLEVPGASVSRSYALAGEIRYRTRPGEGYLEAWSVAPALEGRAVSRTQGTGLMAPIQGDSAWRPFVLPFVTGAESDQPLKLECNVMLPGGGTVEVRNLKFVEGWGAWEGAWFSLEANGIGGAVFGVVIGLWATLLAISRGLWPARAGGVVLMSCGLWLLLGAICLAALFCSCLVGQPWWVRQQLALCAVLLIALGLGFLYPWRSQSSTV